MYLIEACERKKNRKKLGTEICKTYYQRIQQAEQHMQSNIIEKGGGSLFTCGQNTRHTLVFPLFPE